MTVVGYDCVKCGVVYSCDVDESGQRICHGCEEPVSGITRAEAEGRGDVEAR